MNAPRTAFAVLIWIWNGTQRHAHMQTLAEGGGGVQEVGQGGESEREQT